MALTNRIVALAEGRQLEDLARLLEKEGAKPYRCPLLSILDAPDESPILAWLDRLEQGTFAWVVLLTGEGFRRLVALADRQGRRDRVVEAFGKVKVLTRGPKPGQALKEVGLSPSKVAKAPTTDGVIESLREETLQGISVGVQLYSPTNPPLLDFLRDAGASADTVLPYVYAPAADSDRVLELITRLAEGAIDCTVFTSSPQIDRLFEVAKEKGLEETLLKGLAKTKVAAVGPIVEENLIRRGVAVHICPEQGFQMKNLVLHIKRAFEANGD